VADDVTADRVELVKKGDAMSYKFGGWMKQAAREAIKNEAETMDIVKTGRSDERMFRFGAFGNEGVILREAYVKELEQRIQRLEELMRINK